MLYEKETNSSCFSKIAYNDETNELVLTFANGRTYAYEGVGKTIFENICKAKSPGSTFNREVRGLFSYKQI